MAEKRHAERKPARIRVRFWRPGETDRVHRGYTTNISCTGAFIQTDHPHPKGRRLQVEFTTEHNGFVCEALVARAVKIAPELQAVRPSGMGLRFLSVEELLSGFLPRATGTSAAVEALDPSPSQPAESRSAAGQTDEETDTPAPPPAAPTPKKPGEIEIATRQVTRHHPAAAPPRDDGAPTVEAGPADAPSSTEPLTFRLSPPSLEVIRVLFERQIEPGILALPSRTDCRVGRPVRVELKTPPSALGQRILAFEGEVLECGGNPSADAATLRVQIRKNPKALDFLQRLLEIEPSPS